MQIKSFVPAVITLLYLLSSCSSEDKDSIESRHSNLKGEFIYRKHNEYLFHHKPPILAERASYPWEEGSYGVHSKITKEFFRCKGSGLNPVRLLQKEKETLRFYDCGGTQRHSLPLRDQKEFIYPILIDLMNYLQNKTGQRVVITCGHSCIDHNLYLDSSPANQASKHLIGAEVDFYIQGIEHQPEKNVEMIIKYYQENPKYKGQKEYEQFVRYEKGDSQISTKPWYNKEIFIKLYRKNEGRDFDNRHPYPYVSIQVRYDWDLKEKVSYSWEKAFHNLHRW
ncbi:MAG: hypothetical protein H0W88_08895 [Parachlamydiaceae bacterium]|nr:hypothetical protein [Parachlamydiaceae bacterium]